MTSGYRNSSGVDFDDVFDPYVQGTKPGATGYRTSDGVDLNQRYAPLSFGTAAAATGMRLSNGADVNTLWAAKGTASYYTPINSVAASRSNPTGTQNVVEPPTGPATMTVSTGAVSITWNGGSGATVSWSKVSGDTMTVSGTSSASFSATVSKNGSKSAVYRATVSDGTSSGTVDVTVTLFYNAIS